MTWINTAVLAQRNANNAEDNNQIYNGLDSCLTLEIWHRLREQLQLRPNCLATFKFRMGLIAPLIEMSLRGIAVDVEQRNLAIEYLTEVETKLRTLLDRYADAVWDRPLNPNSPKQLQAFFYGTMQFPPIKQSFKGVRKVTTNREALEKLSEHTYARPFVKLIISSREARKLNGVLKSGIDSDNRMRTSYNAGGTETGRLSSNANVFGGGTNLQNITERLRRVFVADKGKKLALPDLEQAESRAVGGIMLRDFNDSAYHLACNSGDLHTTVAIMIWPELPWTEDNKANRKIAEHIFYREMSYRDMSKRGGHGTNYYGQPPQMSRHLKVRAELIEHFQSQYFSAFHLEKWHKKTAQRLTTEQKITTALGMERIFFDRPDDDATLRKGIAYEPQSIVGEVMNKGVLALWQHMPEVELVLQIHDAVGFLYEDNPAKEPALLAKAQKLLEIPVKFGEHTIIIPSEMKIGWNWGNYVPAVNDKGVENSNANTDGLMKWKGQDARIRTQSGLDRLLSTLYRRNSKS